MGPLAGRFDLHRKMTTVLGREFQKHGVQNAYCDDYDRVFGAARAQPIRLLHIGESLECLDAWSDYFTHRDSEIIGLVPTLRDCDHQNEKAKAVFVEDHMMADPAAFGFFDIIIFPASSATSPEALTGALEKWMGALKEGGVFAVENADTTTWPGLDEDFKAIAGHFDVRCERQGGLAFFVRDAA